MFCESVYLSWFFTANIDLVVDYDLFAMMRPSHFCRVRVESESQALRVRVESESSKNFSSPSHDLVESSQNRVTRIVESLRVIDLQARVNVESHEILHFFYYIFNAMKWRQHAPK